MLSTSGLSCLEKPGRGAGPESQGLNLVLEVMGSLTRVCSRREDSHICAGDGYFSGNGRRSEWSGETGVREAGRNPTGMEKARPRL